MPQRKFLTQIVLNSGAVTGVNFDVLSANDLPNSGATAGSYGDATHTAVITVDAFGRITAITTVPISGGGGGMLIGGAVSGGTATCVLYIDGSGNLAQDTHFKWTGSTNGLVVSDPVAGRWQASIADHTNGAAGRFLDNTAGESALLCNGSAAGGFTDPFGNVANLCTGTYAVDTNGPVNSGGGYYVGGTPGQSGTFTTVDGKTVTVTAGIITNIV